MVRLFVIFPVVDTEDAFHGNPSFALRGHKSSNSVFLYKFQVFDFAHTVFGPVAFIEMPEPIAGKFRAVAAEFAVAFGAGAHVAIHAGFRHILLGIIAAVTGIVIAQEGSADAAVHPAGSDQSSSDGIWHSENPIITKAPPPDPSIPSTPQSARCRK